MGIFVALMTGLFCPYCPASHTSETVSAPAQEPKAVVSVPLAPTGERRISGTIVDALDRPIIGVSVQILRSEQDKSEILGYFVSGEGGRFSGSIPKDVEEVEMLLTKHGFVYVNMKVKASEQLECMMYQKIDWSDLDIELWSYGNNFDQKIRELLSSEDGPSSDVADDKESEGEKPNLDDLFFVFQEVSRPALRRLVKDPHIGPKARDLLDLFGDPEDRDFFPKERKYAPKFEISEIDLVDAIKSICGRLNWFSSAPEPKISFESIRFTPKLDRALVRCGINLGPMTGVYWRFGFQKYEKRWVLRSILQYGRN